MESRDYLTLWSKGVEVDPLLDVEVDPLYEVEISTLSRDIDNWCTYPEIRGDVVTSDLNLPAKS